MSLPNQDLPTSTPTPASQAIPNSDVPPQEEANNSDDESSGAENDLLDERAFEDVKATGGEMGNITVYRYQENISTLSQFPHSSEDIDLIHSRIRSLQDLDLRPYAPTLKRICLRQNHIKELVVKTPSQGGDEESGRVGDDYAPLSNMPELEEIDLYDNQISVIEGLENLPNLNSLDLSFNSIRHINPHLSNSSLSKSLTHLYFVQNKISKIQNLDGFTKLDYLELGGNRIRSVANLEPLSPCLTQLWLGKNKLTSLNGLSSLINLRVLSVQSNRIVDIGDSLEKLINLEELYISHNGLRKLDGVGGLGNLTILDVSSNRIEEIGDVSKLTLLEDFWASSNLLQSLESLPFTPELHPNLTTVYLEGNPLEKKEGGNYRRKVKMWMPGIKQIDATGVGP